MREYIRHFRFLFIAVLVLGIAAGVTTAVKSSDAKTYTRTNTECLTKERVFDMADKLTASEEEALRELIALRESQIGCDIVLVTIDEYVPSMMNYADDFYDNNKFGYNAPWGDGAVYVDNWSSGEVWFSTCGRVESAYSDSMIDYLINHVTQITNENPYESYVRYVNTLYEDMNGGVLPFRVNFSAILIFSVVVAAVYMIVNLIHNKGKKTTVANTYVAGGRPNIKRQQDIFVTKHVTRRRIESSSGGGGGHHMSSGGHSHGGGGGSH